MTTHDARRTLLLLAVLATPPPTAAQVNPSGSWRTLHTQHFRIHFRPANRAQALEAAAEAERAYRLLSTELHPPRGIIDLTLSDDYDTANGFTSTYPSNRFTILLIPPSTDPALQTYDSWERLVIVHELTHVFHLDRSRGIWGALQTVFGRVPGLFPNQYQPSWVIEGLAVYYESRFTAGGRAEGSFHREAVGADAVAGNTRSPYDALLFTRWADGLTPYAYGSRFWEFFSQTAGDSLVPRFAETTAGQLIPFRIARPLHRAGAPRDLFDTWKRAIATAAPNAPATQSRLIVGRLRGEPVPRVSPDGTRIAYLYDDGSDAIQLRVADAASGAVLRSHRVNGQVSYDWLGDTLIVAQLEATDRWTVRSDLWRWEPPPSNEWKRLTEAGRLLEPRAGGGVLAALKLGDGVNAPALAPRVSETIVNAPGTTWGEVVPSPDGRWLVAPRHQNGTWQLVRWRAGVRGGEASQSLSVLSPPADFVSDPVWGLGGVLFVTDAAGFPQIHLWREGQGITRLTDEPLGARSPAVLPDGRLLFTTLAHDGWELRSVTALESSGPAAAVTTPATFDSAPRVALRETGYTSWPSLRPHFWIPLAVNHGEAGFFFGAATAGGDAVGRYAYYGTALVSGSPRRAEGGLVVVSNALGDPTLDFSASNHWSLVGVDSTGHVVSSEQRYAAVGTTFLAHRWRSFVSVRVAAEYEGKKYVSEPDTTLADICVGCRSHDLVGGSASLSFGSAVSAPLTVSLQDGATASFLYRYRGEQGTSRWSTEVRARANSYLRLGPKIGYAHPVVAARLALGAMDGPYPDHLSVGGVSSGAAELAFFQTVGTFRSFPVRGYPSGALKGRRAATATVEYRIPLGLVGKSLGHLPFGADKFSFSFFGDIGDAWNPGETPRLDRLRSFGGELVADVTVSYDLPLRVRVGVAQPATGQPQIYGAFAADF
ncbi:MAG TPA: hypothetical protein VG454_09515 [Gemmatimonadales bacterium]|nr:hypothetical protein [Gemmatimonadales bacterium]